MQYRRGWIALMLLTMLIIAYVDRVALSIAAKPIASEFHLSPVAMGYLFSAFVWTYVIGIVPMSYALDRFGTKRVAGGGLLFWSAATVLTGMSWSFVSLLFSRLIFGIGETVCFPVAGRVIRDWIPEQERGQVTTVFNSGSSAGTAIGAPLAAALISLFDWRIAFAILGGAGLLCLAAWAKWFGQPEKVKWLGEAERSKILAERDKSRHAAQSLVRSPPQKLKDLLRIPSVWGLMITQGCMVYTGYLFYMWLPSYLQATLNLSMMWTGIFTAVPLAFAIVAAFLGARLCDKQLTPETIRKGHRRFFVAFSMSLGLAMLLARYMHSAWSLLAVLSVATLSNNMTTALNLTLANDLVENPRDMSRVVALAVLGGNVFGLIAPIVTGYVIATTGGYDDAFAVAAALLVAGAIACLSLSRKPVRASNIPLTP